MQLLLPISLSDCHLQMWFLQVAETSLSDCLHHSDLICGVSENSQISITQLFPNTCWPQWCSQQTCYSDYAGQEPGQIILQFISISVPRFSFMGMGRKEKSVKVCLGYTPSYKRKHFCNSVLSSTGNLKRHTMSMTAEKIWEAASSMCIVVDIVFYDTHI